MGPFMLAAPTCAMEEHQTQGHATEREVNFGMVRGQEAACNASSDQSNDLLFVSGCS